MVVATENEVAHRKVAILIDSLNDETADQLLSQMPLELAATVRESCERLGEVSSQEREAIIEEFLRQTGQSRADVVAGGELDSPGVELEFSSELLGSDTGAAFANDSAPLPQARDRVPGSAAGATAAAMATPAQATNAVRQDSAGGVRRSDSMPRSTRLDFVTSEDVPHLASLIQTESDQVGAVIMGLLEPEVAARLLDGFPLDRQTDMLKRMVVAESPDAEIVSEIVEMVQQDLRRHHQAQSGGGWQAVQAILERSSSSHRDRLRQDVERATRLRFLAARRMETSPGSAAMPERFREETGERPDLSRSQPMPETTSRVTEPAVEPIDWRRGAQSSEVSGAHGEKLGAKSQTDLRISQPAGVNAREDEVRETDPAVALAERAGEAVRGVERADVNQQRTIESRFDQLQHLAPTKLVQLFKQVPPRVMTLALTGAQPRFLNRVLKSLNRREAVRLRREIERSGPVRLADITRAQADVLGLAQEFDNSLGGSVESLQAEA